MKKFLRSLFLSEDEEKRLNTEFVNIKPRGSSGTENYAGYYSEEYLNELRNSKRAKVFDKMRRSDTQVSMCLTAVKAPILQASWTIQAGEEDNEAAKLQADLIEQILFEDINFTKFLREALTFLEFGFSMFEIVNKAVVNHPKFGTYSGLQSLDYRSQKTIETWNLNKENGLLQSVDQYAYGDLQRLVKINADFLLVMNINAEGSNYEGYPVLRPCYGAWLRKNNYEKLNAIGIEKFAVPTPIVKYPNGFQNDPAFDDLENAMIDYTTHQSNFLMVPNTIEIEMNNNTYDPSKVEQSIDNCDKRISKAFLTNFLELGMSGGGAYSLSNDLSDFLLLSLQSVANEVCDKINHKIIPMLVDMNFGKQSVYPKIVCNGISDKAGLELSQVLANLVSGKIISPDAPLEDHIRSLYKLTPKSDEGKVELPEEPVAELSLSERMMRYAKKTG